MKELVILGGPNGAGKTTAARQLVPSALGIHEFVNADEIARGLSPFNPEGVSVAAGRLMLSRIGELVQEGSNFAFETTCSGKSYLRILKLAKSKGYRITLIFLWLSSPKHAIARVARRVQQGGHFVADEVVRRRYYGGVKNLSDIYMPLTDITLVYDNSDLRHKLIATYERGFGIKVVDQSVWKQIKGNPS